MDNVMHNIQFPLLYYVSNGIQPNLLIKVLCEQTRELTHDVLDYV